MDVSWLLSVKRIFDMGSIAKNGNDVFVDFRKCQNVQVFHGWGEYMKGKWNMTSIWEIPLA